ncbi:hypothetical protein ACQ856_18310 [Mycolicibacterium psychrotolerans]|uniref:hypothetical protein n=1 Tax=Mycolicibacterium psychrotolerans TaxID=216929 RepID=UPI003D667F5C
MTIGPHMWFHEDMVNAIFGGRTRAGWSGVVHPDYGTRIICLDALGTHHRWALTGETRECPQMAGTLLHEGVWVD